VSWFVRRRKKKDLHGEYVTTDKKTVVCKWSSEGGESVNKFLIQHQEPSLDERVIISRIHEGGHQTNVISSMLSRRR
jgi:hypothetical protein